MLGLVLGLGSSVIGIGLGLGSSALGLGLGLLLSDATIKRDVRRLGD
ncbi:hypothetical protein [Speluncibacter jeojiensis]|uniref:Uncharacterized protein n=1 Tax=Speluncibacter jeojiensis TaxID=2710754 RepID=A0A9X4RF47_9ACTN|nr:hypothetical protein [Rhodococcus sp. D2-41]MDG3016444.1 hypothetical protein [Corynebacteriales bacterium D3-21]